MYQPGAAVYVPTGVRETGVMHGRASSADDSGPEDAIASESPSGDTEQHRRARQDESEPPPQDPSTDFPDVPNRDVGPNGTDDVDPPPDAESGAGISTYYS